MPLSHLRTDAADRSGWTKFCVESTEIVRNLVKIGGSSSDGFNTDAVADGRICLNFPRIAVDSADAVR